MRSTRVLSFLLGTILLLVGISPLDAQVPSAQQLEMLRSLSPAAREQLLNQLADGSDATASDEEGSSRPELAEGELTSDKSASGKVQDRDRRLAAADTVLLTIDFIQEEPARTQILAEGVPPVVIPAKPAPEYSTEEREQLQKLIDLVRERNPYQLDREGVLQLPGFRPIALAGLTDQEAKKRLEAEPALLKLQVNIQRLPLTKTGPESLKPFGYDLFTRKVSTFAPSTNVPVPSNYVVGPGDQLNVQLFGAQNRNLKLTVGRDGQLNFPELGPIEVAGKTFDVVSNEIEVRVARQIIGTQASVGMGDVRSIQVFVMGEVNKPGAYTVSGLATITSALYASGGIQTTGSLRDIQLKRQGSVVRRLDLYDVLLKGDTSADAALMPGDVVFIPPVGSTVSVAGEVKRPAVYELKGRATLVNVIELAGGLTPEADDSRISVVRYGDDRRRVAVNVSLADPSAKAAAMSNGDFLRVARLRPTIDSGVTLEGHVFRPGVTAWREGMRISELIPSIDELMPNADVNYVLIRRESPNDKSLNVLSADLTAALRDPGSIHNLLLSPRDKVMVFDFQAGRRLLIDPLLEELRRQSRLDDPTRVVAINGRVKAPGDYPLEPEMRISDLLRAGGKLDPAAYSGTAELARFRRFDNERQSELVQVDLAAILRGDASADLVLQPFDVLTIKELPEWSTRESVTLRGEVRFPGTYPIRRGETLRSVIERAGGLSTLAFTRGAVFTREELRQREAQQAKDLSQRLRRDLAAVAIQTSQASQSGDAAQSALAAQSLLAQLEDTQSIGRLVINLDGVLARGIGSRDDIILRNGDELVVPKIKQEVAVIGEVQNSTAHLYRSGLTRDDYLELSGGLTSRADGKRAYVVRADGSVVAGKGGWIGGKADVVIQLGDTIVVPLDTERLPPLPLWQAVTGILYNAAVALAAISSL
jgi:protein involved in polysaccharide export with SLBB domain